MEANAGQFSYRSQRDSVTKMSFYMRNVALVIYFVQGTLENTLDKIYDQCKSFKKPRNKKDNYT